MGAGHLLSPAYVFSAYPGPTVKEIKAMASAAGVEGRTQLLPFLVILPARGRLAFAEMQLILRTMAMTGKVDRDMTSVGTPHFAQFVPLEDQQLGFFTVYDGAFDKYIMDFTRNIGEVFDLIFKFTKDPPPSPCGSMCRSSSTSPQARAEIRSASIKPIPDSPIRTSRR